jgi:CBS domain-containing protein
MTLSREIMTAPAVAFDEDMTLREATVIMARRKVSGAPVMDDDGKLIGVLSESDILEEATRRVGPEMGCPSLSFLSLPYERIVRNEDVCRRFNEVGDVKVGDVMNDEVIAINGDDSAEEALETMIRFDVNRLPVIDEDGRLIGIIARQDIMWSVCRALQADSCKETSPPAPEGVRR